MGDQEILGKLGVRRVVNGAGHLSRLGGSTVSARVRQVIAEAAASYVDLEKLGRAVGDRLATLRCAFEAARC